MMGRKAPRVLHLKLSHDVAETAPGVSLLRTSGAPFYAVERSLRRATEDPRIDGVLVELDELDIGWSRAESLHRALRRVRQGSKVTMAFVSGAGNSAFFVASACGSIVLQPSSTLMLQSLSAESFFLKDLLGELGVRPQLDHVGEYKAAGEMFLRRESSAEHREEIDSLLASLHEQIVTGIAEGRGMSREAVIAGLQAGPFTADDAQKAGLVDHIEYQDACVDLLENELGRKPVLVGPRVRRWLPRPWRYWRPKVAVVHACGVLTTGTGGRPAGRGRAIGARSLVDVLEKLRENHRVKAVVLRIDSPGGSAVGSDILYRAIALTSREKPVVVSMGDVAASGGYYIAAPASAILAEGSTLTGSIGVVGGKFTVDRLLDRLGIQRESRALGSNAFFQSPLQPFSEQERDWHRRALVHFYEKRFLPVVMEGRSLDRERADRAGRGRVWTGRQAIDLGLVDVLGGLDDAIRLAHEKAQLTPARTRVVFQAPRRRLLDWVRRSTTRSTFSSAFEELSDWLALGHDLAREEILLLMPRLFRIR